MAERPRRGEVWWARTGKKLRPVLVISSDSMNRRLAKVLVIPGTTNLRDWPDEVTLEVAFLPGRTAFCCREVAPLALGALERRAGAVGAGPLETVCTTMMAVLGCRPPG